MENEVNNSAQNQQQSQWSIPGAIIVAGLLIAGAVFYGGDAPAPKVADTDKKVEVAQDNGNIQQNGGLDNVNPITSADHILGNINAPVKIIEYSDLECPFCKRFHYTLQQVMDEYGKDGKVAWVYRHFPIESLHSKATKEAEATECANELGGSTKFWEYMDRLIDLTPSNNGLALSQLPEIAKNVGLDEDEFNECLASGRHLARINKDLANAGATGGRGTPWSIVVAEDGTKYPVNGALPYAQVKAIIDQALLK